jgi:hypothetical protein
MRAFHSLRVHGETFNLDARYGNLRYLGGGAYGSVVAADDALTGRRVRMSAAAVLDASGADEPFAELLRLGAEGRAAWAKAHPDAPPAAGAVVMGAVAAALAPRPEAFVIMRRDGRHRALKPGEAPGLPPRAAAPPAADATTPAADVPTPAP